MPKKGLTPIVLSTCGIVLPYTSSAQCLRTLQRPPVAAADAGFLLRLWPQACRETNVVRTQTIQTSFHFSTEQDSTHVKILIHKYGGATFASPSSLLRQKKWAHI